MFAHRVFIWGSSSPPPSFVVDYIHTTCKLLRYKQHWQHVDQAILLANAFVHLYNKLEHWAYWSPVSVLVDDSFTTKTVCILSITMTMALSRLSLCSVCSFFSPFKWYLREWWLSMVPALEDGKIHHIIINVYVRIVCAVLHCTARASAIKHTAHPNRESRESHRVYLKIQYKCCVYSA